MISTTLSPLANHLWQSTVFAAVAWLLTLTLRKNQAAVRYGLWLAASLKFLVPFSLLVGVGSMVEWRPSPAIAAQPIPPILRQMSQPFAEPEPTLLPVAESLPAGGQLPGILFAVWLGGIAISGAYWFRLWRRVRATLRSATPLRMDLPIPVMTSPARLEPGVFGIGKPVLLLPEGIASSLTSAQLQSILAHELCHVRRRDNLAAAILMAVETIFWFHPLVWWIGNRLVEERERACDEEVVRMGNEPHVYAEGILNVCRFYLQSPMRCASGVTGADLKKRIEAIVNDRISHRLTRTRKILLSAAAMAAIVGPIFIGILHAQSKTEQPAFEVASVKPADPDLRQISIRYLPGGGVQAINVTLKQLIALAYNITCGKGGCGERIAGGPGWLDSARFEVVAKGPEPPQAGQSSTSEQALIRQRLQALLADRFNLAVRRETKEMPVYHLVPAKEGHKLKEYAGSDASGGIRGNRPGEIIAERASLYGLVANLTGIVGRPVIDRTGLSGRYDFRLDWVPDMGGGKGPGGPGEKPSVLEAGAGDPSGPSIFTALQEQLGLKLEPQKGQVEIVLIDRAEKPEAN
ncbi:MAG: TIGR03435 family protein [Acidobacteria bacterium]|nr:TIGR03435 family protein [Acidobacteriota bacterium]